MTELNLFEIVVLVLLAGLFLYEFRDPQFLRSWYVNKGRLRRNLSFTAASIIVMALLKLANLALQKSFGGGWLQWHGWFILQLAGCFLVAEFLGWALHFVKHKNGFLWNFHFQHHRESQYNLWLTAHTHALEVIVSGVLMAAALLLLGFSLVAIEIYLAFYAFMKCFQHSAHNYSLGALRWLLITPGYHRLHHEVDSRCNYGITLTIFDLIFRTAKWPEPSTRPIQLGIAADADIPYGFWPEMLHFFKSSSRRR